MYKLRTQICVPCYKEVPVYSYVQTIRTQICVPCYKKVPVYMYKLRTLVSHVIKKFLMTTRCVYKTKDTNLKIAIANYVVDVSSYVASYNFVVS